jgi:hypothetical protein
LRDRGGAAKAEIPNADEQGFGDGGNPLTIHESTGSADVGAAKAMGAFTGWTFAAVNAIAREAANIQLRLYQVTGEDHEEKQDHRLLTLPDGASEKIAGISASPRWRPSSNSERRLKLATQTGPIRVEGAIARPRGSRNRLSN